MAKKSYIFVLLLLLFPHVSYSQYPFGKNKVIYSKKDWKVLETDHVDIYHYPSERSMILSCVPIVEETYREYSSLFGIEFRGRVPLVFYSSHYDFQQTNILPSLISDYTEGFTDLLKGRIAIPFSGSISSLRHVIRHEMVHAFMLEKIEQVVRAHGKFTFSQPPLWFIEGLAEYISLGDADTESRMFVRDALLNDKLPDLNNIWRIEGSFMMYKEGEAVVRYIATNMGKEALIRILDSWWQSEKFDIVLKKTINLNLQELSNAFMKSIKRRYFPAILHSSFAPDVGVQLTKPRSFHSHPVARVTADSALEVYAFCAMHGAVSVCRITKDKRSGPHEKIIIEGGTSSQFESIPAFRSKMEVHGDTLLLVSKSRARDVIYLWDLKENTRINAFSFQNLTIISSPTLSREGNRIVFSAIDTSGTMDLYLYDTKIDELIRLTHDSFSEENPDFSPCDNTILFDSDRCSDGKTANKGIYMLDIASNVITPLICENHSNSEPEWSPDGKAFLYTSDRDGAFNTYLYRDGTIFRETSVIGGITSPSFLPDGSGFVANGYYRGEYQVFYFHLRENVPTNDIDFARVDSTMVQRETLDNETFNFRTKNYKMKLGIDLLGTGLAVDPDFGELGNGAEIVFSDLLGNHQFYTFLGNTSEGLDDFWKRLNLGITYVNLSHRLNYLLGVFHLTTYWGDYFSPFRLERRYGGVVGASYPFSKFSRVEGTVVAKRIERQSDYTELMGGNVKSFLAGTFFSYIVDNTLWTVGGPLKGMRYYFTVGHTFDLMGKGLESTTLNIDIRKYLKLTDRILVAGRFINRDSWGGDFQLFYLGGPWDLRGYDFREFAGKSVFLFNTELRFPLIDRFALSFPFGSLEMPIIRGSLFFDAGKATRFIEDTGWMGSIGAGVELNLGFAPVIRVNFTRATDFDTISSDTKAGLFIGYNY